jgi:hypothetical protein
VIAQRHFVIAQRHFVIAQRHFVIAVHPIAVPVVLTPSPRIIVILAMGIGKNLPVVLFAMTTEVAILTMQRIMIIVPLSPVVLPH